MLGSYAAAALFLAVIVVWVALCLSGSHDSAAASKTTLPYEPVAIPGVLTSAECARLIEHATPRLTRSKTIGDVVSESRTSEQAWVDVSEPSAGEIVRKVRARAAQLTGVFRSDLFEQLQVVRYGAGQEYRPHLDACVEGCDRANKPRVNRRATLLVYLTDDFEAGATHFAKIGARVRPKRGDGVLFYNTDADTGAELADSLHAGEPVASGTKWVANCWVRFDPAAKRV